MEWLVGIVLAVGALAAGAFHALRKKDGQLEVDVARAKALEALGGAKAKVEEKESDKLRETAESMRDLDDAGVADEFMRDYEERQRNRRATEGSRGPK